MAKKMLDRGGVLSEFMSCVNPERENFPKRNRIIAGMADATVLVEAAIKGGSLITANIANSYGREVFAVPGRSIDKYSLGCNSSTSTFLSFQSEFVYFSDPISGISHYTLDGE